MGYRFSVFGCKFYTLRFHHRNNPHPPKRSLWPVFVTPLIMGAFYLAIAYHRFYEDATYIWEHLFVLLLWIVNTGFLMMAVRNVLIRLHLRLVFIPAVLVPAASFFFLYIIYVCSIIGNLTLGETPTFSTILRFVPHLFETSENFEIPSALVVALLAIPFLGLVLIYAGRVREMILWHWVVKESFSLMEKKRRRTWLAFGSSAWILAVMVILLSDPSGGGLEISPMTPSSLFSNPKGIFSP